MAALCFCRSIPFSFPQVDQQRFVNLTLFVPKRIKSQFSQIVKLSQKLSFYRFTSSSLHLSVQWCTRMGRIYGHTSSQSTPSTCHLTRFRLWTWQPTLWRTWPAGSARSERLRRMPMLGSVKHQMSCISKLMQTKSWNTFPDGDTTAAIWIFQLPSVIKFWSWILTNSFCSKLEGLFSVCHFWPNSRVVLSLW